MRYWVYLKDQVCGPVEKEKLAVLPGFTLSTLISPEVPAGGEAAGWKKAETYPEVEAILTPAPAPAQPRRPAAEAVIGMTMRGTLIDEPSVEPTDVFSPVPEKGPAPAVPVPPKEPPGDRVEPDLKQKLDYMCAMLVSLGNNQSQLLERLGRLESAVADVKSLLFPPPPKKY